MNESLAAVFDGTPGRLELRRFLTPDPAPGEILVRVLGCTICGSDLHSYDGRRSVPVPTVLGHEIVGEIDSIGNAAPAYDLAGQPLRIGDRVTWAIVANCGACFYCRRSLPQKCQRAVKYGHEALRPGQELLGGMAEHCLLVRGTSLVLLPEELPLAVACPANCATATVVAALEAAGELRDRTIGIPGCGLLGLTAAAVVAAAGGRAICIDPQPTRRQLALSFGASQAVAPDEAAEIIRVATDGYGADAILELSGAASVWGMALPLLRTGGRMVLVGSVFPGPPVSFVPEQIIRRHLSIHGIHNYAPRHLLAAVKFLAAHYQQFPFESVVADWHDLQETPLALERAHDANAIRIGLTNA